MSNFIINTVRIKNRNVEYLLRMDEGENGKPIVVLQSMNNEYYLQCEYEMPDRTSARSFIDHHSTEFIKLELIRIAFDTDNEATF